MAAIGGGHVGGRLSESTAFAHSFSVGCQVALIFVCSNRINCVQRICENDQNLQNEQELPILKKMNDQVVWSIEILKVWSNQSDST